MLYNCFSISYFNSFLNTLHQKVKQFNKKHFHFSFIQAPNMKCLFYFHREGKLLLSSKPYFCENSNANQLTIWKHSRVFLRFFTMYLQISHGDCVKRFFTDIITQQYFSNETCISSLQLNTVVFNINSIFKNILAYVFFLQSGL